MNRSSSVVFNKLEYSFTNLISCLSNRLPVLIQRYGKRRVVNFPLMPPSGTRKSRTGTFLLPVTQRDHIGEALPQKSTNVLRGLIGNLNSDFSHRINCFGIERCDFIT